MRSFLRVLTQSSLLVHGLLKDSVAQHRLTTVLVRTVVSLGVGTLDLAVSLL